MRDAVRTVVLCQEDRRQVDKDGKKWMGGKGSRWLMVQGSKWAKERIWLSVRGTALGI